MKTLRWNPLLTSKIIVTILVLADAGFDYFLFNSPHDPSFQTVLNTKTVAKITCWLLINFRRIKGSK